MSAIFLSESSAPSPHRTVLETICSGRRRAIEIRHAAKEVPSVSAMCRALAVAKSGIPRVHEEVEVRGLRVRRKRSSDRCEKAT